MTTIIFPMKFTWLRKEEDGDRYHVVKNIKLTGNIRELTSLSSNYPLIINLEQKMSKYLDG